MSFWRTAVVMFCVFLPCFCWAQPVPLPSPFALEPNAPGNYLAPVLVLRGAQSRFQSSPQWHNLYFQKLGQQESFVGNDAAAIADDDAASGPQDKESAASAVAALRGYRPIPARQAVLKLAETHRVLFINEAHNVPMGRAFILLLLNGLYKRGFRYYAAETFHEQAAGLQKHGYAVQDTGYYTREPVFGDTVRMALKLGFHLVPNEYRGPMPSFSEAANSLADENRREQGEAQNLFNRTLKRDPNAKILVQAGYAHISKQVLPVDWPAGDMGAKKGATGTLIPMAVWFQRISGVAPFSIDQASLYAHSAPRYESSLYCYLTGHGIVKDLPVVLEKHGACFVPPDARGVYDCVVAHPRPRYENGRPTWLRLNGLRRAVPLPATLLAVLRAQSVLVQAFAASEDAAQAVPIDQMELAPAQITPDLMLPPGQFLLRVVNANGETLYQQPLTVKE